MIAAALFGLAAPALAQTSPPPPQGQDGKDDQGQLVKDLQVRKQDDILPAWQPDGKSLAYLAEIEAKGKEKKP